jgi:choline dehydrogenase-like flavoprotein
MQIDLESLDTGAEFESEICVVGAGVAGLVLARRLARHGFAVHLLEAGGRELEERSQAFYRAEMAGTPHRGTTDGRFRTYGGASIRWGGQLLAYPDHVFDSREAVGGACWPISGRELVPYHAEVFEIMGTNDLSFESEVLERFGLRETLASPDVRVRLSKFAPFSRRNLARTIGEEVLASSRITVFFHANAVAIDLDPGGASAGSIEVRDYRGRGYRFKARTFVVATGTIEASRLLLSSRSVDAAGVGNRCDQVGRYFHDHVTVPALRLGERAKRVFSRSLAPFFVRGTLHSPKLEASAELQRRLGIPEVMAHFYIHEEEASGLAALRQALVASQRRELTAKHVRALPKLASGLARTAWSLKVRGRRFVSPRAAVSMSIETEQRPRFDSRIRISDSRDALGAPRAIVDWKIGDEEGEAVRRYAPIVGRFLESIGMTDLQWCRAPDAERSAWLEAAGDILHPMGGARMGVSPEKSVVDADLRVHGVRNLYVASCATFPSGGSSNPTFTLMALCCRLADTLNRAR